MSSVFPTPVGGFLNRVAHITSAHPWNDHRIFEKEARALASAGYDVSVIAQRDRAETVDGVHCVPIPVPRGRLERMLLGPWRVFAKRGNFQVFHFHDSELIPVGLALKLLRKKVIYDAHEDLPQQIQDKHWIPRPLRGFVGSVMRIIETGAAHFFDRVVAATPTIAKKFSPEKTVTVCNFPRLESLSPALGIPYEQRPPHFGYVGAISESRGIIQMVDALEELSGFADAGLLLAGAWSPADLMDKMETRVGWAKANYVGLLDRGEVAKLLGGVRAGLVMLHPTPNHLNSLPVKMFEYMASGIPVIASDFPLWREIVGDSGAGLLVKYDDPRAIGAAMRSILEDPREAEAMGARGRQAVLKSYNWNQEAQKLLAMYAGLAAR